MKNAIKLIGIALVAIIIGFSFTACEDGDKGGSNLVPAAPTGLTAYASSSSEIILTWNAVSVAAGYKVYASASYSGTYTLIGQITTNVGRNYNMTPNTTRYYQVTALNSYGESGYSNIAYATTLSDSGGGHTHTYSSTWSSNAAEHWLECTDGDGAKIAVASHTFNGSICLVCNYNKSTGGGGSNFSLNGIWDREDGNVVSIIGSNGYFTLIDGDWKKVEGNGDIKIGSGKFRNISSTGNLTWSAQQLTYNTSTFRIRNWSDCTLTMASDGNTFTVYDPTTQTQSRTYTRKDNNLLNGVWDREDGNVISIIDSKGYFTVIDSAWQKVETNGDIKIGSEKYRNITSTGNLTWSAQELMYNTSTYRVSDWSNCTITMASDGNTFTNHNSTSQTQYRTYTRRR